jgi:hypothetical protein
MELVGYALTIEDMRNVTSPTLDEGPAVPSNGSSASPKPRRRPGSVILIQGGLIAAVITALLTPAIDDAWRALSSRLHGHGPVGGRPGSPVPLAATIECADYCVTEQPHLMMRGTVVGRPPVGHSLRLMVFSFQRGRWYPDTQVPISQGRWTAQVHTGPTKRPAADQQFRVCLVDAGPEFDRDLVGLTTDVDRVNVEGLEREPQPMPVLACAVVVRRGGQA